MFWSKNCFWQNNVCWKRGKNNNISVMVQISTTCSMDLRITIVAGREMKILVSKRKLHLWSWAKYQQWHLEPIIPFIINTISKLDWMNPLDLEDIRWLKSKFLHQKLGLHLLQQMPLHHLFQHQTQNSYQHQPWNPDQIHLGNLWEHCPIICIENFGYHLICPPNQNLVMNTLEHRTWSVAVILFPDLLVLNRPSLVKNLLPAFTDML